MEKMIEFLEAKIEWRLQFVEDTKDIPVTSYAKGHDMGYLKALREIKKFVELMGNNEVHNVD